MGDDVTKKDLQGLEARLTKRITTLKSESESGVKEEVKRIDGNIQFLMEQVGYLKGEIAKLQTAVEADAKRITGIDGRLANIEQKFR